MGRKGLEEAVVSELYSLHEQGLTPYAIHGELGVSVAVVYKYLKQANLQPNIRQTKALAIEKDLLADYYEGLVMDELTRKYNVNVSYLYSLLSRRGLTPRTKTDEAKESYNNRLEHALSLYQNTNLTVGAITLETGISQPTIHKELRSRGIPFRNSKKAKAKREKKKKQQKKT